MEKQILLVCSSGMSTSMMVKAMQKASFDANFPVTISSAPVAGIEDRLKSASVILIGPQIRHRLDNLKEICGKAGVPVDVIPNQIYGLMDGKGALEIARNLMS